jgi:hypothetical protein
LFETQASNGRVHAERRLNSLRFNVAEASQQERLFERAGGTEAERAGLTRHGRSELGIEKDLSSADQRSARVEARSAQNRAPPSPLSRPTCTLMPPSKQFELFGSELILINEENPAAPVAPVTPV